MECIDIEGVEWRSLERVREGSMNPGIIRLTAAENEPYLNF